MASQSIFAPNVNSYEPAFNYKDACRIYFALSDFNKRSDVDYVHVSISKAITNFSVINTDRDQGGDIKTGTGLILNLPIIEDSLKSGLYYVDINNDYIKDGKDGWNLGTIYKIQLRLTKEKCDKIDINEQIKWLNDNANNFSEWSTTITTKAIGEDDIDIPIFANSILQSSNIDIIGTYTNEDITEKMYSVEIIATYKSGSNPSYIPGEIIDNSGILYKEGFDTTNRFVYNTMLNLIENDKIDIKIAVATINKHIYIKTYEMQVSELPKLGDFSLEEIPRNKGFEEDEGFIGLKLTGGETETPRPTHILRVRRASDKDNFKTWEDIHEFILPENYNIDNIEPFYDFTIESGVFYKYGLQEITIDVSEIKRSEMKIIDTELNRVFEYSFLLGAGGRQLKLKYDATISNFQKKYSDVITNTIGGKYPFITRVGSADYYSFTLNGLISFSMDDNNLFIKKDFVYGYDEKTLKGKSINQYDYTYERKFRDEVYKYLTDGKPKLFKSPTEGNIIVRLSNVSLSPNTTLSRLIYSFSATVTEVDDADIKQYRKYDFIPSLSSSVLSGTQSEFLRTKEILNAFE